MNRCYDEIETKSTRRPGLVLERTPARDNSSDVSGERACPDTTQSSGSVEQPPSNSPSRTVISEEPTLRRSERASVRPKYLQDFNSRWTTHRDIVNLEIVVIEYITVLFLFCEEGSCYLV